jgi:hypothetical protein
LPLTFATYPSIFALLRFYGVITVSAVQFNIHNLFRGAQRTSQSYSVTINSHHDYDHIQTQCHQSSIAFDYIPYILGKKINSTFYLVNRLVSAMREVPST